MTKSVNSPLVPLVAVLLVGVGVGWVGSHLTAGAPFAAFDSKIEIGSALDAALAEARETTRLLRLAETLTHLDGNNSARMVAVVEREMSVLSDAELRVIFSAWASVEPEAAVAHPGNERWPIPKRKVAMEAAIESWALHDPLAARQSVDERVAISPRLANYLIGPLIAGWAASGVPGSLDYVRSLPELSRSRAALYIVATLARVLGIEQLLRWADENLGVGDVRFRKDLFDRVVKQAVRRDPPGTAAWVMTHIDEEYAEAGPRLVARLWFPRDPDSAFAWISNQVPEQFQFRTAGSAPRDWLKSDLDRLGAWLESQSRVPLHDAIIGKYASELAETGRKEAIDWAERILDAEMRTNSLISVARLWYQRDPEAALAWLGESALDEAARSAIQTPIGRKRHRGNREGG